MTGPAKTCVAPGGPLDYRGFLDDRFARRASPSPGGDRSDEAAEKTSLPPPACRSPSGNFSMNRPRGRLARSLISAPAGVAGLRPLTWHAMCIAPGGIRGCSRRPTHGVHSSYRAAAVPTITRRFASRVDAVADGRRSSDRRRGLHSGSGRSGCRERTYVRAACGVTIRPVGQGSMSSHGHFGRSIGSSVGLSDVVSPDREAVLRGGHLSRGSGLPAALIAAAALSSARGSAVPGPAVVATRHGSVHRKRAAGAPVHSAGSPRGRSRRTPRGSRTRLRRS